ncbi:MAG: hypothetical protein IJS60_05245 [Abditibacteriota bacterium]|nr:hypothetical protein [Abditibacteriota bacterium]
MIKNSYFKMLIKEFSDKTILDLEDNLRDLEEGGNQLINYKGKSYDIGYDYYTPSDKIAVYEYEDDFLIQKGPDYYFESWEDLFENFKIDGVSFKQIYLFDYDK